MATFLAWPSLAIVTDNKVSQFAQINILNFLPKLKQNIQNPPPPVCSLFSYNRNFVFVWAVNNLIKLWGLDDVEIDNIVSLDTANREFGTNILNSLLPVDRNKVVFLYFMVR